MIQYTDNLIPLMTSNATPLPYKAIYSSEWTSAGYHAWNAFDKSLTTNNAWSPSLAAAGEYVGIDFGENNGKIIEKYTIQTIDNQDNAMGAFTFEGSNVDSTWIILDNQPKTTWSRNQKKEFIISNTDSYRYYRIVVKTAGMTILIKEIEMMSAISTNKFLIKQNSQYYSVKDNALTLLGTPADDTEKKQWFNDYGVEDLKEELLQVDDTQEIMSNSETLDEGNLFKFDIPNGFRNINSIE